MSNSIQLQVVSTVAAVLPAVIVELRLDKLLLFGLLLLLRFSL